MATEYNEDSIRSIEPREHVAMRPGLYFDCFEVGSLDSLAFEIACHAFDEYFDGKCAKLKLTVWSHSVSIWYDAGMSLQERHEGMTAAEAMMTQFYACSNLKKHLAVGQKHCQTGMAAINFAAARCSLTTVWEGQRGTFVFENGVTQRKQIEPDPTGASWTEIFVELNQAVFGELQFTSAGIAEREVEIKAELEGLSFVVDDRIGH